MLVISQIQQNNSKNNINFKKNKFSRFERINDETLLSNKEHPHKKRKNILKYIVGTITSTIASIAAIAIIINNAKNKDSNNLLPEKPNSNVNSQKEPDIKPQTKNKQTDMGMGLSQTKQNEINTTDNNIKNNSNSFYRPNNISANIYGGIDIAEEVFCLIQNGNSTYNSTKKIISEHFPNLEINVHPMSEYDNPAGTKNQNLAAVVRPSYDKNVQLKKVDLFLPEIDSKNEQKLIEYLDKLAHEFTHINQSIRREASDSEYLKPTMSGKFMFYVQKKLLDKFTDNMVTHTAISLIKETGTKLETPDDFNKFMDSPITIEMSENKIAEILGLGINPTEQKKQMISIFNEAFDSLLETMHYESDPIIVDTIYRYGGYEKLRETIRQICAESFKNEEEAYIAGQIVRQNLNGTTNCRTYNDLIHIVMGLCSKSLK